MAADDEVAVVGGDLTFEQGDLLHQILGGFFRCADGWLRSRSLRDPDTSTHASEKKQDKQSGGGKFKHRARTVVRCTIAARCPYRGQ